MSFVFSTLSEAGADVILVQPSDGQRLRYHFSYGSMYTGCSGRRSSFGSSCSAGHPDCCGLYCRRDSRRVCRRQHDGRGCRGQRRRSGSWGCGGSLAVCWRCWDGRCRNSSCWSCRGRSWWSLGWVHGLQHCGLSNFRCFCSSGIAGCSD